MAKINQAIILADSFSSKFVPLTCDTPRALLPLCDIPLIHYSLDLAARSDIQNIIVVCTSHYDKFKEYFENHKYRPLHIVLKYFPKATSLIDILREFENERSITNDFILLPCDIITNINLKNAISCHIKRSQDKNAKQLITFVLCNQDPNSRLLYYQDDVMLTLDTKTSKILNYQSWDCKSKLSFTNKLSLSSKNIELRYNLVDTHILICTPNFLSLFTHTNELVTLRGSFLGDEFVYNIINNELYDHTIYYHEEANKFFSSIPNQQAFFEVSMAVLRRLAYPICPDLMAFKVEKSYLKYFSKNIYKSNRSSIHSTCTFGKNVYIGANTHISENSSFTNCIIGSDCNIESGCRIENSIIFSGSYICSGAEIMGAIISQNVTVKKKSKIKNGCVLGYNVVVKENAEIPPYTLISLYTLKNDKYEKYDGGCDFCSSGGIFNACKYDIINSFEIIGGQFFKDFKGSLAKPDVEFLGSSTSSNPISGSMSNIDGFEKEMYDLIKENMKEDVDKDFIYAQLLTDKNLSKREFHDCIAPVLSCILDSVYLPGKSEDEILAKMQNVFAGWSTFIGKLIFSIPDSKYMLDCLRLYCSTKPYFCTYFHWILPLLTQPLIEQETVSMEVIIEWSKIPDPTSLLVNCKSYIDCLVQSLNEPDDA